ncbi:hypothetical protein DPMN_009738 [Dreissena polymorpha]|uniref:Uncharacterized protein n=1 Tax=Dreissena polymorpha TaxID=45954 RepID=A0A9D4N064_DREPO|nr:hypothetical protein DPMN_009738 [Dreissena polymorpha]
MLCILPRSWFPAEDDPLPCADEELLGAGVCTDLEVLDGCVGLVGLLVEYDDGILEED